MSYGAGPSLVTDALYRALYAGEVTLPVRMMIDRRLPASDKLIELLQPLYEEVVVRAS